jgi:hypothetical protein
MRKIACLVLALAAGCAGMTKPAADDLDLKGLEQRLKATKAIGLFTKLSLKNQVDDLLAKFRAYHGGQKPPTPRFSRTSPPSSRCTACPAPRPPRQTAWATTTTSPPARTTAGTASKRRTAASWSRSRRRQPEAVAVAARELAHRPRCAGDAAAARAIDAAGP